MTLKEREDNLNPAQRQAVDHRAGPLLVVAGAGTGKTRVIVERIVELINSGEAPESIVALTFTEKAAQEMLDRANELRGNYSLDITIATYNAFGEQLLRQHGADIGLSSGLQVLNETGQLVFLRENLDKLNLDYYAPVSQPDGLLSDIANYFSQLKQHLVTPKKYNQYIESLPQNDQAEKIELARHNELAKGFSVYLELCKQSGVIDYDDQIYLLIELLETRPNIQKRLQERYQHLLIDEFQDTNPVQSRLIDLLASKKQNVMVVGDDDQSIYGFRGATLQNILSFKERYPKTKEIVLTQNYRSTQSILDSSYALIQNNNPYRLEAKHGLDKQLVSSVKGLPPQVSQFGNISAEFEWIARDIKQRLANNTDPGSIAILVRKNITAQKIAAVFDSTSLEHATAGQTHDLYSEPIVRTFIEVLKTLVDPLDHLSLYHTLGGRLFGVEPHTLSQLSAEARSKHQPLDELAADHEDKLIQAALTKLKEWRGSVLNKSVGQLCYLILDDSGLKAELLKNADSNADSAQQVHHLSQFFNALGDFERIASSPSALSYLENLPALSAAGEAINDDLSSLSGDKVAILTVHKAKGLEWDVVYIADATTGSFPMRRTSVSIKIPDELSLINAEADEHLREERRLMYVALTRAKTQAIITFSKDHGTKLPKKPSPFIEEALGAEALQSDDVASLQSSLDLFSQKPTRTLDLPAHMSRDGNLNLSVSQLSDYLRCPKDFYFRHVLNVPQEPNSALLHGSAIHNSIEQFNHSQINDTALDLKVLVKNLETSWPKVGWLSAQQRERALTQAKLTMKQFVERETAATRQPTASEEPFSVRLKESSLIIRGRYDAIYQEGDGTEIRDYKTGTTVSSPEKAKRRAQSSDQLTIYAIAWQEANREMPTSLVLDFVETGQIGSVKKTDKALETMRQKLGQAANDIRASKFTPARDHRFCIHE